MTTWPKSLHREAAASGGLVPRNAGCTDWFVGGRHSAARRRAPCRSRAIGLLVWLCFEPPHATAQTRCEVAAASIVSAEGEISLLEAAGSIRFVVAGADTRLCRGDCPRRPSEQSRPSPRRYRSGDPPRSGHDIAGSAAAAAGPAAARPFPWDDPAVQPGSRPLDVQTPYVTAGVEGTEFFVLVNPWRKIAEIGVIEGRVGLENTQGRLTLAAGEQLGAQPGLAPRRSRSTARSGPLGDLLSAGNVGAPGRRCAHRPHRRQRMAGVAGRQCRRGRS